jgi:hypothetical protein
MFGDLGQGSLANQPTNAGQPTNVPELSKGAAASDRRITLLELLIEHCEAFRRAVQSVEEGFRISADEAWKMARLRQDGGALLQLNVTRAKHPADDGSGDIEIVNGKLTLGPQVSEPSGPDSGGRLIKEAIICEDREIWGGREFNLGNIIQNVAHFDFVWPSNKPGLLEAHIGYRDEGGWSTPDIVKTLTTLRSGSPDAVREEQIAKLLDKGRLFLPVAVEMLERLRR